MPRKHFPCDTGKTFCQVIYSEWISYYPFWAVLFDNVSLYFPPVITLTDYLEILVRYLSH